MPIRRLIQRLNTRVRTKRQSVRLDTFDFSTLYTMLAHGPLIEKMNEVFDILFAHQQLDPSCNPPRVFTHIRYHCSASDNRFEFCMSPPPPPTRAARKRKRGDPKPLKWRYLSKVELKEWFSFLISNVWLRFGNILAKQTIGIPMGTNCAVFIANFYLWMCEFDFIRRHIAQNSISVVRKFEHTVRYIDDIFAADNPDF